MGWAAGRDDEEEEKEDADEEEEQKEKEDAGGPSENNTEECLPAIVWKTWTAKKVEQAVRRGVHAFHRFVAGRAYLECFSHVCGIWLSILGMYGTIYNLCMKRARLALCVDGASASWPESLFQ